MPPRMVQKFPDVSLDIRNFTGFLHLEQAGLQNYFGTAQIEGTAHILWTLLSSVEWNQQVWMEGRCGPSSRLGVKRT